MQIKLFFIRKIILELNEFFYLSRPIRKMTARSYSATTLKHTNSEIGNENIIINVEQIIAIISIHVDILRWAGK